MRDSKGRFKSQGLIISLPSAANTLNLILIFFTLLPWIYVASKFNIMDKLYNILNSLFFDNSKCNCSNYENGEFK